eukprot:CAMPEP_0171410946 /NCGR_PEP_ID=MMETSP0880-20121228/28697_1 /TAXON_ID=67004 /ORGANISM="Thalassiosira weissflogii, Strain CCMP1336" /LENGTH=117 /DNA_ID=CAMNT_0011927877 /DNA_START=117 /DNA_END=470 /DNA_ORIENTATION=-
MLAGVASSIDTATSFDGAYCPCDWRLGGGRGRWKGVAPGVAATFVFLEDLNNGENGTRHVVCTCRLSAEKPGSKFTNFLLSVLVVFDEVLTTSKSDDFDEKSKPSILLALSNDLVFS